MRFKPAVMDTELPEILLQFVELAGRREWKKRLSLLERQVRRETGDRSLLAGALPIGIRLLAGLATFPADAGDFD